MHLPKVEHNKREALVPRFPGDLDLDIWTLHMGSHSYPDPWTSTSLASHTSITQHKLRMLKHRPLFAKSIADVFFQIADRQVVYVKTYETGRAV